MEIELVSDHKQVRHKLEEAEDSESFIGIEDYDDRETDYLK